MSLADIPYPIPFVKIIEQPSKSLRFRYLCEGRPATLAGVSSTSDNKTSFAIQVEGYQGHVMVVVSCVSKNRPFRPHPHNLVGLNCKDGLYKLKAEVNGEGTIITFPKMAVQCVKRNDVREVLRVREEKKVDPFSTGFSHKEDLKGIDLHVVRLCVQVFLLKSERLGKTVGLAPIVSDPIYNKKTLPDPIIHRLSHCNSSVRGREDDIILLCNKVSKDDIKIRFFESNNNFTWEDFATFNHIYNSTAICFRPPKYHDQTITDPVKVWVELVRPSDDLKSPAIPFEYLPREAEPGVLYEKRKKYLNRYSLFPHLELNKGERSRRSSLLEDLTPTPQSSGSSTLSPQFLLPLGVETVKENRDPNGFITQLFQNETARNRNRNIFEDGLEQFCQTTRMEETQTPFLDEACSVIPNIEEMLSSTRTNDFNQSRRSTGSDSATLNIPSNDLGSGTINLDSASGVCKILNMDCNQILLEPIHISSGDLEMADIDKLSGTIQDSLVI